MADTRPIQDRGDSTDDPGSPREANMPAVGDSGRPDVLRHDPNAPQTAVGVPHPENRRRHRPRVEAGDAGLPELNDYDDEEQDRPAGREDPRDVLPGVVTPDDGQSDTTPVVI